MTVLRTPWLPDRTGAVHPRILECLLEIADQPRCLSTVIQMLEDLHQFGRESRYAQAMKGTLIWELKSASRGGPAGGARVYFFWTENGEAALINAECKEADSPDPKLMDEVLRCALAYRKGQLKWG